MRYVDFIKKYPDKEKEIGALRKKYGRQVSFNEESIKLRTDLIKVGDVDLGKLSIEILINEISTIEDISVKNITYKKYHYPHPHCDQWGIICFGYDISHVFLEYLIEEKEWLELFRITLNLLNHYGGDEMAYIPLSQFHKQAEGFCDECDLLNCECECEE